MAITISVVTAVYNRADTITHAVESLRSQTWPHVEHVLVDGGSTDGTLHALARFKSGFGVFVSEPDRGIYDALNKGFVRATGDVIGLLHSDDFFANNEALAHVAGAFADPAVDIVFGDLDYVAKDDWSRIVRKWRCGPYSRSAMASGWMPPHPTFYVRRALFQKLGGFDLSMPQAADYDFMIRYLLVAGSHSRYLPEVLVRMRMGGASNHSLGARIQNARENLSAIRKNAIGGAGTLLLNKLRKIPQLL